MEIEWDERKAKSNEAKHKVEFSEAANVFKDPLSSTFADPDHSDKEDRLITIGSSEHGRVLVVVHVERKNKIRIISARKATRRERKAYEEEEQG